MSNAAAPLLAQAVVSLTRPDMRWEFANIAAAIALLSVAFAAIALFCFRRRTRDLTLIYFAVLCALYAVRLLALRPSFRSLFDEPQMFWSYLSWVITCTIVLPLCLFLYQMADEYLRKFLRWLLATQAAFAVFGILAAALQVSMAKLVFANSIVVLGTVAATALFLVASKWSPRKHLTHEIRIFIGGFLVLLLFIVLENLRGLNILPGHSVEFLGVLLFVASLGYVSAYRTLANEERLLAISKELEIARQIQSSTLPQSVPRFRGLEIAARYVPMSAVAGDFYDFLTMDEKRVGILVADVTGHGVPAALIASMLKVAFAGQGAHAHDPALVLAGLNRSLCGKFEEHFVTAAYVFLDLDKNLLRYSSAGHPPLMLASRAAGKVREIEENGLMLGMFPEAAYSSVEIRVGPGDRCLLYTDGVFEAKNAAQEEFGKSRCKEFLESQRDIPATRFANALLDNIASFSGHGSARAQADDITLLVLDFQ
ncbi:MAG TPA: SpoIIE family protein phosphatase [Candidatus Acidoferrales bacterium]|nr:SpoIIE family protein phosphatase [Candidatus Acidoferrales bacterium]